MLRGRIAAVATVTLALCALAGCSSGPAATATPTPVVVIPSPTPGYTQMPSANPEASPTPSAPVDLNGLWDDAGRQVRITQAGSSVTGNYLTPDVCDHQDGTGQTDTTDLDFNGTLQGTTITGNMNACNYGTDNPNGVGFQLVPLTLKVNSDMSALSGTWYDNVDDTNVDITITRVN